MQVKGNSSLLQLWVYDYDLVIYGNSKVISEIWELDKTIFSWFQKHKELDDVMDFCSSLGDLRIDGVIYCTDCKAT